MKGITGANSAVGQYQKLLNLIPNKAENTQSGLQNSFSQVLKDGANTLRESEKLTNLQVMDRIDITQVGTNIAATETMVTLYTALRDKLTNFIQEMQKMPI